MTTTAPNTRATLSCRVPSNRVVAHIPFHHTKYLSNQVFTLYLHLPPIVPEQNGSTPNIIYVQWVLVTTIVSRRSNDLVEASFLIEAFLALARNHTTSHSLFPRQPKSILTQLLCIALAPSCGIYTQQCEIPNLRSRARPEGAAELRELRQDSSAGGLRGTIGVK